MLGLDSELFSDDSDDSDDAELFSELSEDTDDAELTDSDIELAELWEVAVEGEDTELTLLADDAVALLADVAVDGELWVAVDGEDSVWLLWDSEDEDTEVAVLGVEAELADLEL